MNEKGKPSPGGQQSDNKNTFGQMKNQGRNSFAENSPGNVGRSRSNAISNEPGTRSRSNATFEAPGGRARSNAIFGSSEGFKQVKNEGRGTAKDKPDRPGTNSSSTTDAKKNLGRNSYKSSNENRNSLTPSQKAGFNLVSGFMDKLIKKADRANTQQNDPGSKRSQQGTGSQFGQQDEEDKRQRSIQSSKKDDDDDISAGDFFKRLNSAITDPQKFKKEAAQRAQAREQSNNQNESSPGSQQRQQSSSQQPEKDNEQLSGKEFFQRLQGAMKDPAGFKRRVEAQKRTGDKAQAGTSNSLSKLKSLGQQENKAQQQQRAPGQHQQGNVQKRNKPPGGNQPVQRLNQPSKTIPAPQPGNKTGSQPVKKSPRK